MVITDEIARQYIGCNVEEARSGQRPVRTVCTLPPSSHLDLFSSGPEQEFQTAIVVWCLVMENPRPQESFAKEHSPICRILTDLRNDYIYYRNYINKRQGGKLSRLVMISTAEMLTYEVDINIVTVG